MWLEAIFTRGDLESALRHLAPFTLQLGEHGSVRLDAPTSVTLVDKRGLRISCPAVVHGALLGLDIPVTVQSVEILLVPAIVSQGGAEVVLFHVEIEAIDVTLLPHLAEEAVVKSINDAIVQHESKLVWDFRETLSQHIALPGGVTGLRSLNLSAFWGELRITAEALVFVVSVREGARPALSVVAPPAPKRRRARVRWTPRQRIGAGALVAVMLGITVLAAGGLRRKRY